MTTCLPPADYLARHYMGDFKVFGSTTMCGFTLGDALNQPKRVQFAGLTEFVICQFELNLLHQSFHAHFETVDPKWRASLPPFADTRSCSMGHGMGSHRPESILRFAQEPFASPRLEPIALDWDILRDYTRFFLNALLLQGSSNDNPSDILRHQAFLVAIAGDGDCTACVRKTDQWQFRHVRDLLEHPKEPTPGSLDS